MIRNASAGDASELAWFKSSYSSGSEGDSCVEVALDWFKSSYSDGPDGNSCVEIAVAPRTIHVRDSKYPHTSPRLALAPQAWADFVSYAAQA
jgi:U3 small nucleolar ribonucleoprotein component